MATTLEMVDAVVARLRFKLPALVTEYFPERPDEYRLNHAIGALLVSYPGSQYDTTVDTDMVVQPRRVKFAVAIVLRQLNGRGGAIDVLDHVRTALVGFRPPDCKKLAAVSDKFLGESAGLWQYVIEFSAGAVIVEDAEPNDGPLLTQVTYEEES
ncbi:Gp37 family protein [Burkholderia cenocepacia]|uniref:Gp37 family protein n=1 Tax=Burkholderia cenocepacia TaxID=95486 RepID=A0ABD4UQC9_9BURK|nr:Gp37 family protein [Burkholderia cenocepacia]MCW3700370.1 Gp37 family protein [Burkholderia cenocepacia]MCW3707837.1 Gp37 family protein [Burkholderia cenocepacia]MCW3716296.1 Gp37 family protein [Burkholderia cenocepacia]MCW3724633.1 Gp37 family protein [Burkholderia cenocepacia]MCW3731685.1 Gp37 family protein [Burkholderia cenocepacia]